MGAISRPAACGFFVWYGKTQVPKAAVDIRSLARRHTTLALNTLAGIARKGKSEPARVSACVALLERGWGRPQSDVNLNAAITVTVRKMLSDDSDDALMIDVTPDPKKLDQE